MNETILPFPEGDLLLFGKEGRGEIFRRISCSIGLCIFIKINCPISTSSDNKGFLRFPIPIFLTVLSKICIMTIYILGAGYEGIGYRLAVSDEGNS
jgi:hypothetical protein